MASRPWRFNSSRVHPSNVNPSGDNFQKRLAVPDANRAETGGRAEERLEVALDHLFQRCLCWTVNDPPQTKKNGCFRMGGMRYVASCQKFFKRRLPNIHSCGRQNRYKKKCQAFPLGYVDDDAIVSPGFLYPSPFFN